MFNLEDNKYFKKIEEVTNRIVQLCENDYLCEKIIGHEVEHCRRTRCVISYELIYKNIDLYFYENWYTLYVDNYCLKNEYLEIKNGNVHCCGLPIEPTKNGFNLRQIEYSEKNIEKLETIIAMVL